MLVSPGDEIAVEDPLITVESDKASMEIPSSDAGTVKSVLVKLGDQVSEGSAVIELEVAEEQSSGVTPNSSPAQAADSPSSETPQAKSAHSETAAPVAHVDDALVKNADIQAQTVVLGSGPGGAKRVKRQQSWRGTHARD